MFPLAVGEEGVGVENRHLEGRKSDEEHDGMRNSTFGHFGTRKVILAKLLHHGSKTNLN